MYVGMYRRIFVHRYMSTYICMYIGMYVCMQDSGSVQENPFRPWSPGNVRSAPLTKRLWNTVGIARTKRNEVSSNHLEVPACALIVLNILVIIILTLMIIIIITTIIILPVTRPATSTNKKH